MGELAAHPERYDRRKIGVVGTVGMPIEIQGWSAYELGDSAGAITVATRQAGVPRESTQIGVQGEFRARMVFPGEIRPTLLEARRWNPAPRGPTGSPSRRDSS